MKAKTATVPRMSTAATIARIQIHRLRRGPFGDVEGEGHGWWLVVVWEGGVMVELGSAAVMWRDGR